MWAKLSCADRSPTPVKGVACHQAQKAASCKARSQVCTAARHFTANVQQTSLPLPHQTKVAPAWTWINLVGTKNPKWKPYSWQLTQWGRCAVCVYLCIYICLCNGPRLACLCLWSSSALKLARPQQATRTKQANEGDSLECQSQETDHLTDPGPTSQLDPKTAKLAISGP